MGPAFQSFAWKQMGSLRIFALVQVFWAAAFFWLHGMGGALLRERRSWIYILFSVLCSFAYLVLDPWDVADQKRMLLRGTTQFAFAVFLWHWLCVRFTRDSWRSFFLTCIAFLLSSALFVVVLRLLTHDTWSAAISVSLSDALLYCIVSTAAALLIESKFAARVPDALIVFGELGNTHRAYLRSLFLAGLVYTLVGICLAGPDSLLWSLLAPVIPILAAVYASYRWFSLSGQAVDIPGLLIAKRPELFLGIFFQYLSIILLLSIWLSLRRSPSYLRYGLSHVALFAYWSPSWWLLAKL